VLGTVRVVVLVVVVVDVDVEVVVSSSAGLWAGASTGRRAASATKIKQTAINVPMVTVFLKSIPATDSA
jgi:hypothetical protein